MCLIMATCGPGGTYCRGNYHRSGFEYFARRVYVSLTIHGQILFKTVRNTATSQMWCKMVVWPMSIKCSCTECRHVDGRGGYSDPITRCTLVKLNC